MFVRFKVFQLFLLSNPFPTSFFFLLFTHAHACLIRVRLISEQATKREINRTVAAPFTHLSGLLYLCVCACISIQAHGQHWRDCDGAREPRMLAQPKTKCYPRSRGRERGRRERARAQESQRYALPSAKNCNANKSKATAQINSQHTHTLPHCERGRERTQTPRPTPISMPFERGGRTTQVGVVQSRSVCCSL